VVDHARAFYAQQSAAVTRLSSTRRKQIKTSA